MPVISGNVNGSVSTVSYNVPCKVISGFLVNRTGGNVIVNMYVATSGGDRAIVPVNLTLISNTMYVMEDKIKLNAESYFIIVTNGSLDYYFSVEPV